MIIFAAETAAGDRLTGKNVTKIVILRYSYPTRAVNIGDLKARLSAHIRLVRDGEEVIVCDRNQPVARIVPCRVQDLSKHEQRLVARGVLAPSKKRRSSSSSPHPPGNISDEVMEQLWRDERER
ncbi:MAG TPA: type II toxin-antitoxin system prevent-host-death family antitoxin [Terriglobales bacterium]|nr:type II toxin-antitoxin system prevent-host-death family antitoxin [Terriglobales bacterium]